MKRDIKHTDTQTLRLLDQIGQVGRFDENFKLHFCEGEVSQLSFGYDSFCKTAPVTQSLVIPLLKNKCE